MHSSLVTTVEGVPLGLAAVKFWTKKKFKGIAALKRKVDPTRVPIGEKESVRWLDNLAQLTKLLGAPERRSVSTTLRHPGGLIRLGLSALRLAG
jgi:hypothetical protein